MSQPWKKANEASRYSLNDAVGRPMLFCFGGVHDRYKLPSGELVSAARFNCVDLTTGTEHLDALSFAGKFIDQVRSDVGGIVLGKVKAERGRGNNDMLSIDTVITPEDEQWANYWASQNPGRIEALQQLALASFSVEEAKLGGNGAQPAQTQAAPPPPPPPPASPPPAAAPAYAAPPPAGPPVPPDPQAPPPWAQNTPPAGPPSAPPY